MGLKAFKLRFILNTLIRAWQFYGLDFGVEAKTASGLVLALAPYGPVVDLVVSRC